MSNDTEILRSLGRLEGKCDAIIVSLKDHTDRMNRIDRDVVSLDNKVSRQVSELNKKVATIDKKQYAVFTVATIAWSVIALFIKKFF